MAGLPGQAPTVASVAGVSVSGGQQPRDLGGRPAVTPAGVPRALGWLAPAVAEASVVLDLVEGRVEGPELVSDALDCRAHVRPITVSPVSSDEAVVAQAVVDRAIGHKGPGLRRQQMDDVVFPEREADIDLVPVGAAAFHQELVARQAFLDRNVGPGLGLDAFGHASQPPDEDLPVT
jgi:hypothetical protein